MTALQQLPALDRPKCAGSLAPPTRVEDLRPGLLLFFARPSGLQTWAELFGHEWRHVGVTVQMPDGLRVASYGPRKCFRLDDPAEFLSAYTRVGVGDVFDGDVEVDGVQRFCRRFEQLERSDSPYVFSSVLIGPLHLYARKRAPGPLRSLLLFIVYLYCLLQGLRYRDRTAYLCSTFAWEIVQVCRQQPLRIPLSAHPEDAAAYATLPTARDELYARWLCGPTELWQALSPASRSELDLESLALDAQSRDDGCGRDAAGAREDASSPRAKQPGPPRSRGGRIGRMVAVTVATWLRSAH